MLVFVGDVIGRLLRLLLGVVLARGLGTARFGTFCLALTIQEMIERIGRVSLPQGVLKYVAHYNALGDKERLAGTVRGAAALNGAAGILLCVALALAAPALAARVYDHPELARPIQILALSIPFTIVQGVLLASLQAVHRLAAPVAIRALVVPGGLALGAWLALSIEDSLTAPALAFPITAAVGCFTAWLGVRYRLAPAAGGAKPVIPWRELVDIALPMVVLSVFVFGGRGVDVLALGRLLPHDQLGVYSAAAQGASVIAFPLIAVNFVFAPSISAFHARGDQAGMSQTFIRATGITTYAAMWLFGAAFCLRHQLLAMFGAEFETGVAALVIICLGQLASSAPGGVRVVLVMAGRPWLAVLDNVIFAIAMLGALVFVAPHWGITGCAVVVAVALGGLQLTRVLRVWKLYGMLPYNMASASLWLYFAAGMLLAVLTALVLPGRTGAILSLVAFALPMAFPIARMRERLRSLIATGRQDESQDIQDGE